MVSTLTFACPNALTGVPEEQNFSPASKFPSSNEKLIVKNVMSEQKLDNGRKELTRYSQ